MVEKMYGPAVFYEDAVNSLVPEEYSKAAEESKLDIVSRPEINVEPVSYTHLDVYKRQGSRRCILLSARFARELPFAFCRQLYTHKNNCAREKRKILKKFRKIKKTCKILEM